jgi:hypothetical protein
LMGGARTLPGRSGKGLIALRGAATAEVRDVNRSVPVQGNGSSLEIAVLVCECRNHIARAMPMMRFAIRFGPRSQDSAAK